MSVNTRREVWSLEVFILQRPTAQDLLRHRFIKMARKTSHLMELIERYQRWRREEGQEEENDVEHTE